MSTNHYLIEITQTNTAIVYRTNDGKIEPGVTGPHPSLEAALAALPEGAVYSVCKLEPLPEVAENPRGKYSGGVVRREANNGH